MQAVRTLLLGVLIATLLVGCAERSVTTTNLDAAVSNGQPGPALTVQKDGDRAIDVRFARVEAAIAYDIMYSSDGESWVRVVLDQTDSSHLSARIHDLTGDRVTVTARVVFASEPKWGPLSVSEWTDPQTFTVPRVSGPPSASTPVSDELGWTDLENGFLSELILKRTGPDSAGGVGAKMEFRSVTSLDIAYVRFRVTPYNAVGDAVKSSIGDTSTTWLKYTGPVVAGGFGSGSWRPIWYNGTIKELRIDRVEIEFMNDDVVEFEGPGRVFE